jgi:Phage capsid protein
MAADTLTDVQVSTFERNVRYRSQQFASKLRGTTQERGEQSKDHNWDIKGIVEAVDKNSRLTPTPLLNIPNTRRVAVPTPHHAGDAVEHDEIVKMIIDPLSTGYNSLVYAMNRKTDDKIIAAATGLALNGDSTTTAYDYTNNAVGDYTVPISFDSVTAIVESFGNDEIDPSIMKTAAIGPTQVRKLLQTTQQTSGDYVHREALQKLSTSGVAYNWMGFNWIMTTRLLDGGDTGGGAGTKDLLFYTYDAMGLQVNRDIWSRIAEDPTRSFAWILYAESTMNAIRVQDEHMKVLKCLDAIA